MEEMKYAFLALVQACSHLCPNQRQTFQTHDVIAFSLQKMHQTPASGALRDVAYMQQNTFDYGGLLSMCAFFLDYASRPIINQAVRSMFQCLGVRLRALRTSDTRDYVDLFRDTETAKHIIETRTRDDDILRAAYIVAILSPDHDDNYGSKIKSYFQENADERLWILRLFSPYGHVILATPERFHDSKRFVLAAVQFVILGNTASPRLCDDREVVLRAVQFRGTNLMYASARLQDDREIVLAALRMSTYGTAINYASDRLQRDPELIAIVEEKRR